MWAQSSGVAQQVFLPEAQGLHSLPSDQDFLYFPETDTSVITKTMSFHIHRWWERENAVFPMKTYYDIKFVALCRNS